MFCVSCGMPMDLSSKFCTGCGIPIAIGSDVQPAPASGSAASRPKAESAPAQHDRSLAPSSVIVTARGFHGNR
jgi:hypothetical protein